MHALSPVLSFGFADQKLCFEVACEVGWTSDVPFVRWSSVVAWFVDIGRESGWRRLVSHVFLGSPPLAGRGFCCSPCWFDVLNRFSCHIVFWSILEHMGHKEHGGTWHMEAAQLDTQRKKGEAILKTSSTVHSTNRSSSPTRPAKLQLDRAGESKSNPKNVASPLTSL
ncbi:unnamed protein product [Microthlaspi erraticum]|uniref:Uncharacterized protein n=1 Tax=Microthlaspi erraticum TaxID=1685480 RepID=A0A6D2I7E1_9BRAS|nr:unnamed protein product [Microthlaspi erraticum]